MVNAFNYWLTDQGKGQYRDRTISLAMAEYTRRWRSRRTGQTFSLVKSGGRMFYVGLCFTTFFRKAWDAAPKDTLGRALAKGKIDDTPAVGKAIDYRGEF